VLVKLTNRCSLGCTHCSEDATPLGAHMTWETFEKTLDAVRRMECTMELFGLPIFMLLSGGECTEHPDIVRMVKACIACDFCVTIITNGMWLSNRELRAALLRPEWTRPRLNVQVTNDRRFYPQSPLQVIDDRVQYVTEIPQLIPIGRAARKQKTEKKAPTSFNFRSLTRSFKSFEKAVLTLRMQAYSGRVYGWCTPSIDVEGNVLAGETRFCHKIGTVDSSNEELTKAVLSMGTCNRCGLEDKLSPEHRRAIGLETREADCV